MSGLTLSDVPAAQRPDLPLAQQCNDLTSAEFQREWLELSMPMCSVIRHGNSSSQNSKKSAKLEGQPVLTYEEIMGVSTIKGLKTRYARKGISFKNDDEFIERVEYDWRHAAYHQAQQVSSEPFSNTVKPLRVTADGEKYAIYGVVHAFRIGNESRQAVSNAIDSQDNLLFEQNLDWIFKIKNGIELPDHMVSSLKSPYSALTQFWVGFKMAIPFLGTYLPGPDDVLPYSDLDDESDCEYFFKDQGSGDRTSRRMRRVMRAHEAITSSGDLPPYVSIEMKRKRGEDLNDCQARSAYMAEMLRRWDVDGEKAILVGRAHAAEVAYFLKHPSDDPIILQLAEEHAAELNSGSKSDLDRVVKRRFEHIDWRKVGMVAGAVLVGHIMGTLLRHLVLQPLFYRVDIIPDRRDLRENPALDNSECNQNVRQKSAA